MGVKENKELAQRFFIPPDEKFHREALKTKNPQAVIEKRIRQITKEFVTPDVVIHEPFGDWGLEEYIQGNAMMAIAIPNMTWSIDDMFGEGDQIAARYSWHGTHEGPLLGVPGTGKELTGNGAYICRFKRGKIIEIWSYYDSMVTLQQLGVMPKI